MGRISFDRRHTALAAGVIALLAACAGGGAPTDVGTPRADRTVAGVVYHADLLVMESFPVQLRSIVTAENSTGDTVTIEVPDGCTVLLRAYRDESRSGSPAWDQAGSAMCTMALRRTTLAPGESREFGSVTVGAGEILGDSLPDGRYYLSAVIRPNGQTVELAAGATELAN